jgi:hypothetical protein
MLYDGEEQLQEQENFPAMKNALEFHCEKRSKVNRPSVLRKIYRRPAP